MKINFSYQEKILRCSNSLSHNAKIIFKYMKDTFLSHGKRHATSSGYAIKQTHKKQHPPEKKVVFSLERRAFSISIRIALERYL